MKLFPIVTLATLLVPVVARGQNNAPKTDDVTASFGLLEIARSQERTCQGADGTYLEFHQEHTGPITSTEARLDGTLTTNTFILVNRDTGLGTAHGTLQIRDATTNDLKLTGRFSGALSAGGRFKGLVVGELIGGGSLTAAVSIVFDFVTGASVGDMGSPVAVVVSDLGVIQTGSCSGGFGSP